MWVGGWVGGSVCLCEWCVWCVCVDVSVLCAYVCVHISTN